VLSSPTFGVFLGLVDKYVMRKTDKKIFRNLEKLLEPELMVLIMRRISQQWVFLDDYQSSTSGHFIMELACSLELGMQ
jgi:hypothetical protein